MTVEKSDNPIVHGGTGGGKEVVELALMFDLTGQEMEAVEDAGSVHGALTALQGAGDPEEAGISSGVVREGVGGSPWTRSGTTSRPVGTARLATEFLGPAPGGPLPETPVMETVEPLFPEEEEMVDPAPDAGSLLHEMEAVDGGFAPAWADAGPTSAGVGPARRVMPWLPSTDEGDTEGVVQAPDVAGRGSARRPGPVSPVRRHDLEETEPFDLQHVALITEGKRRREVFQRSENLGEEIIVRLTLPTKAAGEPVEPEADRPAPRPAAVSRFAADALVSVFAQSAEDAWESEADESVATVAEAVAEATVAEGVAEATVVEAMPLEISMPWVGVAEEEPPATIPVWEATEVKAEVKVEVHVEVQAEADAAPPLESVEPFSVDTLKRVVRSRGVEPPRDWSRVRVATVAPEERAAVCVGNPWGAEELVAVAQVTPWEAAVPVSSGGDEERLGPQESAAFLVNRVEPFDRQQLLSMARESLDREAGEPPVYAWGDNPWNFEQLPPGGTDREPVVLARPAVVSGLKVEVKASRVPLPVAPKPVVRVHPPVVPKPVVRVEAVSPRVSPAASSSFVAAEAGHREPVAARTETAALEVELLSAIRETARVARESAQVVRESAILTVESANAMRRAVQVPRGGGELPPEIPVTRVPSPVAGSGSDRVVVPVEKMFSGISNALGDMVGSVVGRRPGRVRRG